MAGRLGDDAMSGLEHMAGQTLLRDRRGVTRPRTPPSSAESRNGLTVIVCAKRDPRGVRPHTRRCPRFEPFPQTGWTLRRTHLLRGRAGM